MEKDQLSTVTMRVQVVLRGNITVRGVRSCDDQKGLARCIETVGDCVHREPVEYATLS